MRFALAALTLTALAAAARGDEPPELLPPPRLSESPPVVIVVPVYPGFFRPDPRAVWQTVDLDRRGYYRPRVAWSPDPYYIYNGQPFNLLPVKQQSIRPVVIGR